eukprot:11858855-Alexandrium_andersonii.AAC.1
MLVSVAVKTQTQVAQSSAEAELGGVHRGAILGVCARNIWEDAFGEWLPITIATDSSLGRA